MGTFETLIRSCVYSDLYIEMLNLNKVIVLAENQSCKSIIIIIILIYYLDSKIMKTEETENFSYTIVGRKGHLPSDPPSVRI